MKKWSSSWISSSQPRKQRKYRYEAPSHVRQKFVSAHLSEPLRTRFGIRSLPVRKGDEVRILRGEKRGFKGKVERVDLKKSIIFVEGLNVKKVNGSEVAKAVEPSNLMITDAKMEDKKRQAVVERARADKDTELEREKPKKDGKKK